jgi:hypothetical protein
MWTFVYGCRHLHLCPKIRSFWVVLNSHYLRRRKKRLESMFEDGMIICFSTTVLVYKPTLSTISSLHTPLYIFTLSQSPHIQFPILLHAHNNSYTSYTFSHSLHSIHSIIIVFTLPKLHTFLHTLTVPFPPVHHTLPTHSPGIPYSSHSSFENSMKLTKCQWSEAHFLVMLLLGFQNL